jgi:Ion transport protein
MTITSRLFPTVTMDGWTDVVRQVTVAVPLASIGFVIFVICTGFVVLNLMIAVVCESLMNVKEIEAAKQREKESEIIVEEASESFEDEPEDSWAHTAQPETIDQIQLVKQDLERVKDEMQKSLADINEEMIRTRETMKAILLRLP